VTQSRPLDLSLVPTQDSTGMRLGGERGPRSRLGSRRSHRPVARQSRAAERTRCTDDDKGNRRVVLNVTKDGPGLALNDEKAHPRAFVAVTKDGPGITLLDEKTNLRVVLEVGEYGPFMALNDGEDNPARGVRENAT
jgi:hypothetical protein